jgi:small subunit ribosomal protein S8
MKFTNHHVSDLVVRIKNATQRNHISLFVPNVRIVKDVLTLLVEQGYILSYNVKDFEIEVFLKYLQNDSVIKSINVVSKPSKRVYKGVKELPSFYNGLGISIISTPKGILTDEQARQFSVGGEILCQVF